MCPSVDVDNGGHVKGVKVLSVERNMSSVVTRLWYEFEDGIGLLPGDVTAEQLGLDPVYGDQDTVTGCEDG